MRVHHREAGEQGLAYLANGIIGLRVPAAPVLEGQARAGGVFERNPRIDHEAIARIPYPLGLSIAIGPCSTASFEDGSLR